MGNAEVTKMKNSDFTDLYCVNGPIVFSFKERTTSTVDIFG